MSNNDEMALGAVDTIGKQAMSVKNGTGDLRN